MGHWANYTGSLDMPHFADAIEKRVELHLSDGRTIAYSTQDIAEQDADYYRKRGIEAEVRTRIVHIRREILW